MGHDMQRMTRRSLLATLAGAAGAVVVAPLASLGRSPADEGGGNPVGVGGTSERVRSQARREAGGDSAAALAFAAVDTEGHQHEVEVGPHGIKTRNTGHWSQGAVTIDSTVEAVGSGAEAAATGPMIVGRGDIMGVLGAANGEGPGVRGVGAVGVEGVGPIGVDALGEGGPGVRARGERGGDFAGGIAQLQLRPSDLRTHPALGEPGEPLRRSVSTIVVLRRRHGLEAGGIGRRS